MNIQSIDSKEKKGCGVVDIPFLPSQQSHSKLLVLFLILIFSFLSWRFLQRVLIVQEHWEYGNNSNKYRFQFPCGLMRCLVNLRFHCSRSLLCPQREHCYIKCDHRRWYPLQPISYVDFLYSCEGRIYQDTLTFSEVQQRKLDTETNYLQQSSLTKILWSPTSILRLMDHDFALLNYKNMGTMILQNNQFKLTRVLQSLLHTSSKILDIAQQDDRLFFLYDSLELQMYSLSSHSWKSYHRIPL